MAPSASSLAVAALLVAGLFSVPTRAVAAEPVCFLACDTLDPAKAGQESFPVPEHNLNGRRLVLHVSDVDGMAWGSIDNGGQGDAVWLDRSWDGGRTWEGLLGKASIPATWTGTRTLMYNISDPRDHRRGLIRACGDAAGVGCTQWAYPVVCDALCDGTDAGQADDDVQPVPAATLAGRVIRLHTDRRGMAWATIDAGGPGDEVWLDRSWNEGASWPDGSSLGRTTGTRTALFASRDPRARLYGGAVRACGRASTGQNGSCTAWARPAPDRAGAAADALMYAYDPNPGWWPSSWWNTAATLTTLIEHGDPRYDWVISRTFEQNKGTFPAGVRGSDPIEGGFVSRAIDDSAWWGLAWVAVHDRTGDARYLRMATTIADYVHGYWDTGSCGGGVWWDRERTYKNAVTAGLYLRLAAAVHNRTPGDTVWLDRTRAAAAWYLGSGLINNANWSTTGSPGTAATTARRSGPTTRAWPSAAFSRRGAPPVTARSWTRPGGSPTRRSPASRATEC